MQKTIQLVTGYGTYSFNKKKRYYRIRAKRGILSGEIYKKIVRRVNQQQFKSLVATPHVENLQGLINAYFLHQMESRKIKLKEPVKVEKGKDYELRTIEKPKKKSLLRRIIDWLLGRK